MDECIIIVLNPADAETKGLLFEFNVSLISRTSVNVMQSDLIHLFFERSRKRVGAGVELDGTCCLWF